MHRTATPRTAWVMWGIGLLAYAVAVFGRASLGVTGLQAQHRFGASAVVLALFSVLQLAVYASLQVPVGVALDRLGSRRLIAVGAVVMAAGQLALATATSIPAAVGARVLVGAGDALTFISVLRLVALWFAARQVPVVTQLTGIMGQLGQVAAAYPLVALLRSAGWTASYAGAAGVSAVVAVLVAAALRDAPPGTVAPTPTPLQQVRALVGQAWAEPGTRIGFWTHFVTQFSGTVFALLWGYPFLVAGEGLRPSTAGLLLSLLVVVGMVVAPVLGRLAGGWPLRRSALVFAVVGSSALAWTACWRGQGGPHWRCWSPWSWCWRRTVPGRCSASTTPARRTRRRASAAPAAWSTSVASPPRSRRSWSSGWFSTCSPPAG